MYIDEYNNESFNSSRRHALNNKASKDIKDKLEFKEQIDKSTIRTEI